MDTIIPDSLNRPCVLNMNSYQRIVFLPFLILVTAVTPMSPRLEDQTYKALLTQLTNAGMTENGASSVVVSLVEVLGAGHERRTYTYRELYSGFPFVDAEAHPFEMHCMKAHLTIWMPADPDKNLLLDGMYCLTDQTGQYEWKAQSQKLEGVLGASAP